MMSISLDKIISYQIIRGGAKKEHFFYYISRLINSQFLVNTGKVPVFFLDNATIHHRKKYSKKYLKTT